MRKILYGVILIGILLASSCVKSYMLPLRDPVDSTGVKIIRVDTISTGDERFKEIFYRNKIGS